MHLLRATLVAFTGVTGGSIGWGIFVFSLAARLALLPLTLRAAREGEKLRALQPRLEKASAEERLQLLREAGVSPLGSLTQLLWQAPIFGGLYSAIGGIKSASFLWIRDLRAPDPLLALAAAALGAIAGAFGAQKAAQILLPAAITLFIAWRVSAASGLYFAANGVVSVIQAALIARRSPPRPPRG